MSLKCVFKISLNMTLDHKMFAKCDFMNVFKM